MTVHDNIGPNFDFVVVEHWSRVSILPCAEHAWIIQNVPGVQLDVLSILSEDIFVIVRPCGFNR